MRAVQLRERGLADRELYRLAERTKLLCDEFGATLLINDRIDVAVAIDAAGVHLGGSSFPVGRAREVVGKRLIGASAHSVEEARKAQAEGADFLVFGPVYFTPSKAFYGDPVGEEKLGEAAQSVCLPVFAIGGIKLPRIPVILGRGAQGAAVISAILSAQDPRRAASDMVSVLPEC